MEDMAQRSPRNLLGVQGSRCHRNGPRPNSKSGSKSGFNLRFGFTNLGRPIFLVLTVSTCGRRKCRPTLFIWDLDFTPKRTCLAMSNKFGSAGRVYWTNPQNEPIGLTSALRFGHREGKNHRTLCLFRSNSQRKDRDKAGFTQWARRAERILERFEEFHSSCFEFTKGGNDVLSQLNSRRL